MSDNSVIGWLSRLRSWQLFVLAGVLFVTDLLGAGPHPVHRRDHARTDDVDTGAVEEASLVSAPRRLDWRPFGLLALLTVLTLAWVPVLHSAQLGAVVNDLAGFGRYKRFTTYDQYFAKYSKRFFGVGFDWRYFKAQAVAESNLRPDARSPAGAVGVMQVMPRTFDEIRRKNPAIAGSVDQPRWNIAAGIWYDRQQFVVWAAERSLIERLKFMFGSYNAGRANILRAQQLALSEGLNATLWKSVAGELSRVTGRRSQETVTYVARVLDIKQALR